MDESKKQAANQVISRSVRWMSWNKDGNVESGRPQRAREGSGERHERKERRVVVCRCAGFRPGADSSSMTTSDQQQGVSLRILCVDACAAAQVWRGSTNLTCLLLRLSVGAIRVGIEADAVVLCVLFMPDPCM